MTYAIIIITSLVSAVALRNGELMQRLLLSPYLVFRNRQWYRLITHALVHANYLHLIVNMIVLLSFGKAVESILRQLNMEGVIGHPVLHYLMLYLGGAVVATLTTLKKFRNDYSYQSVGASGAVSGMIFFCIFFYPLNKLYLMGILPIPGILFAVAYLIYSNYISRKGGDNINHDAHFVGAVFGFIYPLLISPKLITVFLKQLGLM